MKKAVIEDASIELLELFDEVSKEARIEKNAVPPINKMIYYWTRKPLIVGRAMALASTLDNIEDVKSLLGLDTENRAYKYVPDKTIFAKKLGMDPKEIKVLDPFAGAGSLAFPSVQLGLDVTVSDYNPIAYLLEKSVLQFPAKYGMDLAADVEKYATQLIKMTKNEIGKFFGLNQLAYLWCWCITCPHCDQRVPLLNQMYVANNVKKKIGINIIPNNKNFDIEIIYNMSQDDGKKFTQKAGKVICISCKNSIDYKTMTEDIAKNRDREMLVIQIQKNNGRDYIIPTTEDKELYEDAVNYFNLKRKEFEANNLIPNEFIKPSFRRENHLWHYGIKHWDEYFDERQKLVLCTFLKNIKEICKIINNKEYRSVIALYLTSVLLQRVNMSGFGIPWNTSGEKPEHVLTLRRPSILLNFAESNPFEKSRGSLNNIQKNIINGIIFATRLENQSISKLQSVTLSSDITYDVILTDPPYGDDVQYGEQSEFFYVWTYRALKDYFPELPPTVNLDEDFCESWGRFGDKKLASEFFGKGLKKSFVSINDKLKDDGLLVVFFAHSTTKAWNQFLDSIREANFKVISSYSIHTESTSNVLARGKTSFMSSIVVTCRKILEPSEAFYENLRAPIEDKIKNMLKQIPENKLLALPITDLLIMVYGKVLEVCTQHTILKSHVKDFTPDFETLIKDARSFIMKELVGKITGKSINTIGTRMAFYLLIKIFHKGIIGGDDAIKISQTYNVDIKDLEKDQVVIKDKDVIRLYYLNENEMDYSPDNVDKNNLYQQMCYLAYTADSRGLDKIPTILTLDNFRTEDLKQVISLLIQSYHLRRNKGESLIAQEQKELEILETLGDTAGVKSEGTMDSYIEK
jgi:putative DNA methylase